MLPYLLDIADDFLLCLVAGQPIVKVSDNVNADLAGQLIAGLWGG